MLGPAPPRSVIDWLNRQDTEMLYLSTITMAERRQRLWVLPDGRRRRSLSERFDRFVADGFSSKLVTSINAP